MTTRILLILAAACFTTGLFARMTDPMVPMIASDLGVDMHAVALLATAYALTWAVMQPVVGPLGDLFGKTRVITVCLAILLASAAVGAVATNFSVLMASRIIAGLAAGGIAPVTMAFIADVVPLESRQVAMSRLLTAGIAGLLVGSAASGIIADLVGWRGIFVIGAGIVALVLVTAVLGLRGASPPVRDKPSFAGAIANYRVLLANPRTKVCYGAVFLEGIAIFGVFPFVAILLLATGEDRAAIAGLVLAGFAIGGVIYAMVIGPLLRRVSSRALMIAGGLAAAAALLLEATGPSWPVQAVALTLLGFGFYLMHGGIMVQMSELAPNSRGTAVAGHAASFYLGQALGPVVFGLGFAVAGPSITLGLSAALIVAVAVVTSRLLYSRMVNS